MSSFLTSTLYTLLFLATSSSAVVIELGGVGSCADCDKPGHFCGNDGECHEFSCQNYYQFAAVELTGYADNVPFECFGYENGDIENAHGVIYGCDPIYPFTLITPGKQVTEPFNRKCTAEREGGFLFECYEFQQSTTATNFDMFETEADSSFPDCGEGKIPAYYYIIASSNHYVGFEGLQGNPILAGGADIDGDTLWSAKNPGNPNEFSREIAMYSMYANVVGGPPPVQHVNTIEAGPMGDNPLRNPQDKPHGGYADDSPAVSGRNVSWLSAVLGFGMVVYQLWN